MALVFNGSGHAVRASGGITALEEFTILLAVKRTSLQTGNRYLLTIRSNSESGGHNCFLYNGGFGSDAAPVLFPNYGATNADNNILLPLDEWMWVAIVGDGTDIYLLQYDGGTWVTAATTQTTFTPVHLRLADSGTSTDRLTCKMAHIREWNAVRSESELSAEIDSNTPVITADLVSAKSGLGANLAAALLGETGTTFTASGTVTVDADEPEFSATADAVVSQSLGDFTQTLTTDSLGEALVSQVLSDFSQILEVSLESDVVVSQNLEDFSQLVELGVLIPMQANQILEDFSQLVTLEPLPLPGTFDVTQLLGDFSQTFVATKSISAPPVPEYNSISFGPGEYGVPVNGAARNLKREYQKRWPTR